MGMDMTLTDDCRLIAGIEGLVDRYHTYIIDLWGVLHDGVTAFPGAADALLRLRTAGCRVVLLSNSPARVADVSHRMEGMGIDPGCYDLLITSGEFTHLALAKCPLRAPPASGRTLFHLGPMHDRSLFDGLAGFDLVADIDLADLIVITGPVGATDQLDVYVPLLTLAAARVIPMICANPDRIVIQGGRMKICAGTIAAYYQGLGAPVAWIGKPWPAIYQHLLERIGNPGPAGMLIIGDGLETDIAGAARINADSALIASGIHHEDIMAGGSRVDLGRLAQLTNRVGVVPNWVMPRFCWGGDAG